MIKKLRTTTRPSEANRDGAQARVVAPKAVQPAKNVKADDATILKIKEKIQQNGYVCVDVRGLYYFTLGMSSVGKRDLFALGHAPYSMFQIIADRYRKENWGIDSVYKINEFMIPALLREPSRVKLAVLDSEDNNNLKNSLVKIQKHFDVDGFNIVLLPDSDNLLYGDANTKMVKSPKAMIVELTMALIEDVNKEHEEALKILKALR